MKTNDEYRLRLWWLLLILLITSTFGLVLAHYGPASFDGPLLLWFRVNGDTGLLAGPQWMASFWSGLSGLGDKTPRIVISVLALFALLLLRRWHAALFIAGVLISGTLLTAILKHGIARPRPQLVSHLDHISSQSFPSGHTLTSTLFYLTLAWLLAPLLSRRISRLFLYTLAIILSLAIGVSRIALGVHWPSDVLASWVIATTWLCLWVLLANHFWPEALKDQTSDRL
ncbi:MAG TPA: phosphatase PAP2 family protein [Gammaproteobacteria bacterium]|nr:phosphatase PAP2 family protein [Gammaproteobacteria bacterium]